MLVWKPLFRVLGLGTRRDFYPIFSEHYIIPSEKSNFFKIWLCGFQGVSCQMVGGGGGLLHFAE